jgi:hypothetical protein
MERGHYKEIPRKFKGLVGFGYGWKIKNNEYTGEPSIIFYVKQKNNDNVDLLPEKYEEITTDVQEVIDEKLLNCDEVDFDVCYYDSIKSGINIGKPSVNQLYARSGTLGGITNDKRILTCYHVLMYHMDSENVLNENNKILQPSPKYDCIHSRNMNNNIATFYDGRYGNFDVDVGNNKMIKIGLDVALCNDIVRSFITDNFKGWYSYAEIIKIDNNQQNKIIFKKNGFKTGKTTGYITEIFTLSRSEIEEHSELGVLYDCELLMQIEIQGNERDVIFCDKGDSGSIFVDDDNKILGILNAGRNYPTHTTAIVTPFYAIAYVMGIEI